MFCNVMLVLGSNHRFGSVESQLLRLFSRASNLSSGVVQVTCIVRFSNVFPLRLAFILGQRVNEGFQQYLQCKILDSHKFWSKLTVEIVSFCSIRASKDSLCRVMSWACVKYYCVKRPTHREEANSFDNKIINCDDITEYHNAFQILNIWKFTINEYPVSSIVGTWSAVIIK